VPIKTWGLPFGNTSLLLYSGLTIILAHKVFISRELNLAMSVLAFTIVIGLLFMFIQFNKYKAAQFSIYDSACGFCFYTITGLHSLHVMAVTIFLAIALM
jgi:cytochrome c oxidase subunit 3